MANVSAIIKTILLVPFVILFYIIVLLLLILVSPTLIVRGVISWFCRGWGNMLDPCSTYFAMNLSSNTLIQSCTVEGEPDIHKLRDECWFKFIEAKTENGTILYPQLRQCLVQWCGYYFWRDIPNFQQIYHNYSGSIHLPDLDLEDTAKVENVLSSLTKKTWMLNGDPLWDAKILTGKNEGRFIIIIRFHHGLMDAMSAIKLFGKICTFKGNDERIMKYNLPPQTFLFKLMIFFRIPEDFMHLLYYTRVARNSTNLAGRNLQGSVTAAGFSSKSLNLNRIKEIKNLHNVTLTSMVISTMTDALRQHLMKSQGDIQSNIVLDFTLPLPNHPDGLVNYVTLGFMELPLKEKDPTVRMKFIESQLDYVKQSTIPLIVWKLVNLFGSQCIPLLRPLVKGGDKQQRYYLVSLQAPGYSTVAGHRILRNGLAINGMANKKMLGFCFITSGGHAYFSVFGDSGIIDVPDCTNLVTNWAMKLKEMGQEGP